MSAPSCMYRCTPRRSSMQWPTPRARLPRATGPCAALHVVGIEAAETEVPHRGKPRSTTCTQLRPSPARCFPTLLKFPTYFVRLRGGANDIARFKSDVGTTGIGGTEVLDTQAELVASSIHPQAVGWRLLAVLTLLAGLAMVGQAIGRQSAVEGEGYETLRVLGLTPGQLVGLGMARTFAVGLVGAAGAVVLAFALSLVAPLGEVRFAGDIDRSVDRRPRPSDRLSGHDRRCSPCRDVADRTARRDVSTTAAPSPPDHPEPPARRLGRRPCAVVGARHALDRGRYVYDAGAHGASSAPSWPSSCAAVPPSSAAA